MADQQLTVLDRDELQDERIQRVDRFQTLQAGTYWRYTGQSGLPEPENRLDAIRAWVRREVDVMPVGIVLLLNRIDVVDERPHTVHLTPHPLASERWSEHRVLIDEFLANWQYAPDGEAVRDRELASLQMEVSDLQRELAEGQANPALMAPAIEQAVNEWEAGKREAAAASGETSPSTSLSAAGQARTTSVADVVGNRMTADQVAGLSLAAEKQLVIAETTSRWLSSRVDAIVAKIGGMTPFYKERAAVALARTSEVRKYAADLMSGIRSLDLYTLRGVEIQTLVIGEEAPSDLPLTVLQAKAFMDEELAAWADVDAKFDFTDDDAFVEQLASNPSLRDQIFPTERCVVSMATRRHAVDYGKMDSFGAEMRNEVNRKVFLLVRNGENVHRVYSATPSHEATPRLFPTSAEIDGIFGGFDGSRIDFKSLQFTDRHKQAEDVALHYKRFLILLCGLDHRAEGSLFGRFYDEAQSLSFISLDFQQRYMRFVADDDPASMLPSMNPRPTVWEFLAAKNAFLQSGSRVIAYYPNALTPASAPSTRKLVEMERRDYTERLADPVDADGQAIDAGTHVAYRDGAEICINVHVARRESFRDYAQPTFNARLSLTALKNESIFAYACLDAMTAQEVEAYIHDRRSRIEHVEFIRLFKRTAASLRKEEAAEADSRRWLLSTITEAGLGESEAERVTMVADSVRAWRAANRGAALPPVSDKKAFDTILSHIHSLGVKSDDYVALLTRHAAACGYVPLKATLTGKNRLALYVEVPPAERDERLMSFRWVRRISITLLKTKITEASSRLVWMTGNEDAKETDLHVWPEAAAWVNTTPEPFPHRAMVAALEVVDASVPRMLEMLGRGEGIAEPSFSTIKARMRSRMMSGSVVRYAPLSVPIGAFVEHSKDAKRPATIRFLVATGHAAKWLLHAGTPEQRQEVRAAYRSVFAEPEKASVQQLFASVEEPFEPNFRVQDRVDAELPYDAESDSEETGWIEVAQWRDRLVDGDTRDRGTREVRVPGNAMMKMRIGERVKRTPNELLTFLMHDRQTEHQREKSRRYWGGYGSPFPPQIYLNPLVYDGDVGTIEEAFSLNVEPRPCVAPEVESTTDGDRSEVDTEQPVPAAAPGAG